MTVCGAEEPEDSRRYPGRPARIKVAKDRDEVLRTVDRIREKVLTRG
ncbi:hypothetical protein AB0L59_39220 [Streptomyces sp. NPDC052109]